MPKTFELQDPYEIKAVNELYDLYEYKLRKSDYKACEVLISVFCILNKHLTNSTGWQIKYEGSPAKDLYNVKLDGWHDEQGKFHRWTVD